MKKKVIGVALSAMLLALGIIGAHAQQAGKVFEFSIFKPACEARKMQQPRVTALSKRLLRNQLFREVKIKVRNQHPVDYRTCGTKVRKDGCQAPGG